MGQQTLSRVLPQILRFLDAQSGRKQTDGRLLEQFIIQRDESAFAVLVERHGPMVLRVCRRVLRDAHEAEDAFQATFLVLALRAAAVRRRESLGSWLYGVARRVAAKAGVRSDRRRGLEASAAAVVPVPSAPAAEWTEFRGILDEELSRLPELYRRPFVLCCLEEKTQEQAAAELSYPRSSLASRLARAKVVLRRRLTERGVVPAALTAVAVRTASAAVHGSGISGTTPARVLALAQSAMKAFSATHVIVILSLALFAGAGVVAAGALAPPAKGDKPVTPPAVAPAAAAADSLEAERIDRYGDPLPPGALMRLGTVRFRNGGYGLNDAVYSPDGKILATAGNNGRIHLWDAADGKDIGVLESEKNTNVLSLAFSPDGKTLASAARSTEPIRLWDTAAWEVRFRLQGPKAINWVSRVAFSPDGKTLAAAHMDGAVFLWNPATGKRLPSADEHEFMIGGIDLSPDGRTLATASPDERKVRLWDFTTGRRIRTLSSGRTVLSPAFSPDGARVSTVLMYGPPAVWETATGRELPALPLPADARTRTLNGAITAVAGQDETLRLLETATGKELHTFRNIGKQVWTVYLSPDGKTLATYTAPEWTGRQDEKGKRIYKDAPTVRLWDVATEQETHRIGDADTKQVVFSPDGRTAALWEPGRVRFWDVGSGQPLNELTHSEIGGCRFSPDGRTLATFSSTQSGVHIWELASGRERFTLAGHGDGTSCALFTPDGRKLITGGMDSTVLVWDLAPARPDTEKLDRLWSELEDDDASHAYEALWAMSGSPGAVDFLMARLKPAAEAQGNEIHQLIADLDSDDFDVREKASAGLERIGAGAEYALLGTLAGKPSAEAGRRVRLLLETLQRHPTRLPAEELQGLRALEVLERIGGPDARCVLETLATGGEDRLTREAKASLARLEKR